MSIFAFAVDTTLAIAALYASFRAPSSAVRSLAFMLAVALALQGAAELLERKRVADAAKKSTNTFSLRYAVVVLRATSYIVMFSALVRAAQPKRVTIAPTAEK